MLSLTLLCDVDKGLAQSGEQYTEAVECLRSRYDRPRLVHQMHVRKIMDIPHWDSTENMTAIRDRVALLMKGCKCKTGCTTGRCGCHKKGQACSEGCTCMHCKNMSHCVLNEEMDETLSREQTIDDEFLDFVMESEDERDSTYDDSESDDSLYI